MSYPFAQHWATLRFKVGVPTERQEQLIDTLYSTAVSKPDIDQPGFLSWSVSGEWKDDDFEKVIMPFLDDLENDVWEYEVENETGYLRIHNGTIECCGIMPDGNWQEITLGEEVTA